MPKTPKYNSHAYYASFVKTTERIRKDKAKARCKKGKPCSNICLPKKARCNENKTEKVNPDRSVSSLNPALGAAGVGLALAGLGLHEIYRHGGKVEQNKKQQINRGLKIVDNYEENLKTWNKKYANKPINEFTDEELQQAYDEFQENRKKVKTKAGFDPDPDFEKRWEQAKKTGKYKLDSTDDIAEINCWNILGVNKEPPPHELRSAYRKLTTRHRHDDNTWNEVDAAYKQAIDRYPSIPHAYWYSSPTHDLCNSWRKPLDLV